MIRQVLDDPDILGKVFAGILITAVLLWMGYCVVVADQSPDDCVASDPVVNPLSELPEYECSERDYGGYEIYP